MVGRSETEVPSSDKIDMDEREIGFLHFAYKSERMNELEFAKSWPGLLSNLLFFY